MATNSLHTYPAPRTGGEPIVEGDSGPPQRVDAGPAADQVVAGEPAQAAAVAQPPVGVAAQPVADAAGANEAMVGANAAANGPANGAANGAGDDGAGIARPVSIDVPGGQQTIHIITMPDRTRAAAREVQWCIQRQCEMVIYDNESSTGAFYKLLSRLDLLNVTLSIDKKAVAAVRAHQPLSATFSLTPYYLVVCAQGTITQPEFDTVMRCLSQSNARKVPMLTPAGSCTQPHMPPTRCSQANLLPVRCVITAAKSLGDSPRIRALLQGLREPLPRSWELRCGSRMVPLASQALR